MAATTFIARYTSECPSCSTSIEIGEEAVYTTGADGDVIHAQCGTPLPDASAPVEVCQKCWQARSVAGVCGCYDTETW